MQMPDMYQPTNSTHPTAESRGSVRIPLLLTIAVAVVFVSNVASAQQYPPVWTDIMTQQGSTTMASGNYYPVGSGQPPILNTNLTGIQNTLSMPQSVLPGSGGTGNSSCGSISQPVAYLESNQGSEITGVGFLGTFNSPGGLLFAPYNEPPYSITFQPNSNMFESVFFNENLCYNGGREYGFFLAASDNSIWAYWGTHENQDTQQGQFQLSYQNNVLGNGVTIQPNTQYYFEMYPVLGAYGTCAFEVAVYTADNTSQPVFAAAPPVTAYGADNILAVDGDFCNAIASDTGYVSANIEAVPWGAVTGTLPSPSVLNLSLQRVFVGKL